MTDQQRQQLDRLTDQYVTYRQRYVLCLPGGLNVVPKDRTGTYCKLTRGVLLNHLEQKYAVCVYAGKWGSKFMCFDVDDGNRETVFRIISELERLGVPRRMIYVSYSGGKGYHVELFCRDIIPTEQWYWLYLSVIRTGNLDPGKVEFRPTHTQSIKLPLSCHAKSGKVCWYVDRDTQEMVESVEYLQEIRQMNTTDVPVVTPQESSMRLPHLNTDKSRASDATRRLGTEIVTAGTRHNILRNIAVYQRCQGVCREECESNLLTWYAQQNHELVRTDYQQVERDIRNIIKWVYSECFVVPYSCAPNDATLCASQMRLAMQQPNRTCRRLVFLLLLRCRMLRPRMSMEDMSRVIGVSRVSISKAVKRLSKAGVITFEEGRRMMTEQDGFQAESRKYCVPHEAGTQGEEQITVSMRELIFDFDRCYHQAMHHLLPQETIKNMLSKQEWNEYLDTMKGASE